jgi:uncharacterized protein
MYLLDTNVWLELLLNQTRAPEVSQLLKALNSSDLALSDFSLHPICVILGRTQRLTLLEQFVTDLFVQAQTALVALSGAEVQSVTKACLALASIAEFPRNASRNELKKT